MARKLHEAAGLPDCICFIIHFTSSFLLYISVYLLLLYLTVVQYFILLF